jgi:hypothetical protein
MSIGPRPGTARPDNGHETGGKDPMSVHPGFSPAAESGLASIPGLDPRVCVDVARIQLPIIHALRSGRVVLVCARVSAEGGDAAREGAVDGASTALEVLALAGLDYTGVATPREELLLLVQHAHPVPSDRGPGEKGFTNWWYLDDSAAEYGLVVLVQWGTGNLQDKDFNQPALDILAARILDTAPMVTFANEIRGYGRGAFEFRPVVNAVKRVARDTGVTGYVGFTDDEYSIDNEDHQLLQPISDKLEARIFHAGLEARREANRTYRRTRLGMRRHLQTDKPRGPFRISVGLQLPPPMASAHMLDDHVEAFLDTPADRPEPATVKHGLPMCRTAEGELADQVKNVRWFYAHYYLPDWPPAKTAAHLVAHGYSTMGLRQSRHSDDVTYRLPPPTAKASGEAAGEAPEERWSAPRPPRSATRSGGRGSSTAPGT